MHRSIVLTILLIGCAGLTLAQPAQTIVSGTLTGPTGAVAPNVQVQLLETRLPGEISTVPSPPLLYRTNASGVVTITVPRNSQIRLYAAAHPLNRNGTQGVWLQVPDASTANLNAMVTVSLQPLTGLTVKIGGSPLPNRVGTIDFVSGATVTESPAGEANVTILGGGGGSPLTAEEADGTPSIANVVTLRVNQAHGLTLSNPSANVAQINLPSIPYASLTGVPSTFAPSAHSSSHHSGGGDAIALGSIAGTLTQAQHGDLSATSTTSPRHHWDQITNKPSQFTPASHTHPASEITAGQLALIRGGTGADLSGTGPGYLKQATTGAALTVGAIAAADLPSGIDAAKVADGSVSNAEFQRLDGVTSGIQGQLDAKAATGHTHAWADVSKTGSSLADLATRAISDTTGILGPTRGGTGQSAYAAGDILIADATNSLARLAAGSNGLVLKMVSGLPAWATDETGAGGSGIATLNTLTSTTQTFTSPDDANVTLDITSSGSNHAFTLGWTGTLAKARQHAATAYTDQANSFSGNQTFSALAIFNGGQVLKRTATATSYSVVTTDSTIAITSTAAPRTITLPSSGLTAGQVFTVKDESGGAGTNNITIDGNGALIDGASTVILDVGFGSVSVYWDGSAFHLR